MHHLGSESNLVGNSRDTGPPGVGGWVCTQMSSRWQSPQCYDFSVYNIQCHCHIMGKRQHGPLPYHALSCHLWVNLQHEFTWFTWCLIRPCHESLPQWAHSSYQLPYHPHYGSKESMGTNALPGMPHALSDHTVVSRENMGPYGLPCALSQPLLLPKAHTLPASVYAILWSQGGIRTTCFARYPSMPCNKY